MSDFDLVNSSAFGGLLNIHMFLGVPESGVLYFPVRLGTFFKTSYQASFTKGSIIQSWFLNFPEKRRHPNRDAAKVYYLYQYILYYSLFKKLL